jgi:hypothetical protein
VSDASGEDDRSLVEWQETRTVIARYDGYLNDLRKLSFPFITGTLAISGFVGSISSISGTIVLLSPNIYTGVFIAIMGLIVAVAVLDTLYCNFELAASVRAGILEKRLNLDITNDFAYLSDKESWSKYVHLLYGVLVVVAFVLGVAFIWGDAWYTYVPLAVALILSILFMNHIFKKKSIHLYDWGVDKKILTQGDYLRITFTNLNHEYDTIPGNFLISWKITSDESNEDIDLKKIAAKKLKYSEDYSWLWKAEAKTGQLQMLTLTFTTTDKETWNLFKDKTKLDSFVKKEGKLPKDETDKLSKAMTLTLGDEEKNLTHIQVQIV